MELDPKKENRISALYISLAADFLKRESMGNGLLTVTGISISKNRKNMAILFTVFPDKYEEQALKFAKRKRSEFREFVKEKTKDLAFCPIFDFEIDLGEKNRQHIDSLIQKANGLNP
jgi:ribosome-binding factor A